MAWYSQRDQRWASQRLGTCDGVTIGSDGCYVTSFANMANDCGKDVTPAQLDDECTGKFYVDGCLCTDDLLTKIYPDIVFQGIDNYPPGVTTDLSKLNNDPTVKQILEVDGQPNTPGLQTHFVYFYDYYNGVVRVIDAWTGLLINLANVYGNPSDVIYKIITYTFNPPTPVAPAPAPAADPAPVLPPPHVEPVPAPAPVVTPPPVVAPAPSVAPSAPATPSPVQVPVTSVPPVTPDPTPVKAQTLWDVLSSLLGKLIDFLKSFKRSN